MISAKTNAIFDYMGMIGSILMGLLSLILLISPDMLQKVFAKDVLANMSNSDRERLSNLSNNGIRVYAGATALVSGLSAYLSMVSGRCNWKC